MALFGSVSGTNANTTLDTTGSTNINQNQTGTSTTTNTSTGTTSAFQNPLDTAFQSGLYQHYNKAINNAEASPVYGTGFQAGYLGNLNTAADAATKSLEQTLAANGQSNSGALAVGAGDIQGNKFNQYAQLEANLPAMESQAETARLDPLLAGATSLSAAAPVSYTTNNASNSQTLSASTLQSIIDSILKSVGHSTSESGSVGF